MKPHASCLMHSTLIRLNSLFYFHYFTCSNFRHARSVISSISSQCSSMQPNALSLAITHSFTDFSYLFPN
uniref:Uncharacterized protein n=1 Tax=Pristionchus pacificus TaxID=54126 RepID=A0A2A6C823_PRIPA|eukprot:PDM74355.1 hypothetical protein PRIPAC_41711 [Pristionchus pacificus]